MRIDTHTHFYDPTRPGGVPWPPKEDTILYRPVLPEHWKALAQPLGVTQTIVVEASPWLEDNQWILDLAEKEPSLVGFVGNLDIHADSFEEHLARFAVHPLFRGIRLRRLGNPQENGTLAHLATLAEHDLSLDLLTDAEGLKDVETLAACVPTLRIVLDHVAHVPITGSAPDAKWLEGICRLGKYENVFVKVSALVELAQTKPTPTDLAYYRPTLDVLWNAFGQERLLFGSNWPVCERFADYATVVRLVESYFALKGSAVEERFFSGNALRVYKPKR